MLDGLKMAFGTLSAIPVPAPERIDRPVAGWAMILAPLTQLPLVCALLVWGWVVREASLPAPVSASAALVAITLATRGMHLDGLADTADGLSASYDRATALDVMRRSDIGPSGVAAVVLVLLVDASALASLLTTGRGVILACLSLIASRHLLAWACAAGVPAARQEGLGATVSGTVRRPMVVLCLLLILGVSTLAAQLTGSTWWAGPVLVGSAVIGGVTVIQRATRRLGGITGDVLGAVVEVSFAAALTASAMLLIGG